MINDTMSTYVSADEVAKEWAVSKVTAYKIIKELNCSLKEHEPIAIVIPGKVNRAWYDKAKLAKHIQYTDHEPAI